MIVLAPVSGAIVALLARLDYTVAADRSAVRVVLVVGAAGAAAIALDQPGAHGHLRRRRCRAPRAAPSSDGRMKNYTNPDMHPALHSA